MAKWMRRKREGMTDGRLVGKKRDPLALPLPASSFSRLSHEYNQSRSRNRKGRPQSVFQSDCALNAEAVLPFRTMIPPQAMASTAQVGWAMGTKLLPPASKQKDLGKFFCQC